MYPGVQWRTYSPYSGVSLIKPGPLAAGVTHVVSQCPMFNIIQAVDVATDAVAVFVKEPGHLLGVCGELVELGLSDHGVYRETVVNIDEEGLSLKLE